MKSSKIILTNTFTCIALMALATFLFPSCTDDCETTYTYFSYEPIYTSLDEIRSSVAITEPEELKSPGKIYLYGNILLVNEHGKGIHVIDNQDKTAPKHLSFIDIPGNVDMAVKNNILYADSYVDLLAFNISDINNIQLIKRIEDTFPNYSTFGFHVDSDRGVVTDWKQTETTEIAASDCNGEQPIDFFWRGNVLMSFAEGDMAASLQNRSVGNTTGIGGSMARFTIYQNFLYAVDDFDMHVFNISSPADPQENGIVNIGWGIETIFPYKDKLFIGARNGMHIFDNSTPTQPQYMSTFQHANSCDPVVVNDEYAFVTLRSGTNCENFNNQLDVVDIKDLRNPTLVKTYPMTNPHGLGIDGNTLFLCEGASGLKVFNIEDVENIDQNLRLHFDNLDAYDVIPFQNNLILIGVDGLYQFDYSDSDNLKLQSKLLIATE
ncbi:hypothetical protein QQ008_05860 [Fulvivirgaceae bacterium BMA10]|uniref:LVIVD repeat-containing protein n=1 Tax=Splendidivirga corallicola TaxID=3051826 RepID=A0ABT8KKW4_9BACT|nr:hypothetical protein [Fulvivirgaceae bacterium BMA10]